MVKEKPIYLRQLAVEDVSDAYRQWLLDPNVNAYLESRWSNPSLPDLCDYVASMVASPNDFLFGIFEAKTDSHIGNVKIGGINWIHRYGDIGIIIGEPEGRGKGYGAYAVEMVCHYAFTELNLRKVIAGMYANNVASIAAFSKAGFTKTGTMKEHYLCNGTFVDGVLMELLKEEN